MLSSFFRFLNQFFFRFSNSSFFRFSSSFSFLFSNSVFFLSSSSSFFRFSNQYSFDEFSFRSVNSSNSSFFRCLNSLNSSFFRLLKMSFFYSASVRFYVVISRISNKKKRVKFLSISENVNFFRDAKMIESDAKMKNVKKKYQFLQYKNYKSIRN